MGTLSRREFTKLCGGTVMTGVSLSAWPLRGEAAGQAEISGASLTGMTLTEASAKIRDRIVTPTQLTKAVLSRIELYDPKLNSYITVMREEALLQAAELDTEQNAGKFRGPLHGIPIAVKDNVDTAGVRTTAASEVFQTRVPSEDADIIRRLKASGGIIMGKLNLHEFALGCSGDVSFFGPTRNPWALDRVTGGSSAGSGASVAADLCFAALGTDTGGSIRVPSSWCGIVGIKPTTGLVSIRGIIPCAASLDHCGPMARTVEDVALMLNHMAGYDELDIFSVDHGAEDYVKAMKESVSGLRLGVPAEFFDHLEPEVSSAVAVAIDVLSKLTSGIKSRAPMPTIPAGWSFFQGLGDTASYHQDLVKNSLMAYMPPTRKELEATVKNFTATAADSARAHDALVLMRRKIDSVFKDIDLVVVPTTRGLPPKINDSLADEMGTKKPHVYDFFEGSSGCANTAPFDVFGIPAISLPCGFSKDGLPIGLMIAGPHFAEGKVLALAYAYQQATEWHKRKPKLSPETPVPPLVEA
jgi:aspartyl-tRNA(Asn)/glutamyl-tRNA(Gln) amidotransferase subunit A